MRAAVGRRFRGGRPLNPVARVFDFALVLGRFKGLRPRFTRRLRRPRPGLRLERGGVARIAPAGAKRQNVNSIHRRERRGRRFSVTRLAVHPTCDERSGVNSSGPHSPVWGPGPNVCLGSALRALEGTRHSIYHASRGVKSRASGFEARASYLWSSFSVGRTRQAAPCAAVVRSRALRRRAWSSIGAPRRHAPLRRLESRAF